MSAFETWFIEQHGRRTNSAVSRTDAQLRELIHAGEEAARELRRRNEWDARHESALYAWQAQSPVGKPTDGSK